MIHRTITPSFWTDPKVADEFTPEDRYFYLYLLTNPHTDISGCYEISTRAMARETGYNEDSVKHLLNRMQNVHRVIVYDGETKEVLILNWSKYNWTVSPKLLKAVELSARTIKNETFKDFVLAKKDGEKYPIDTLFSTPDTSITIAIPIATTSAIPSDYKQIKIEKREEIEQIVEYLNRRAGTAFRASSKATAAHIKARLAEGFTVEDFRTVIDRKVADWGHDQKMAKYLRPETLFGTKFEGYLNERTPSGDRVMDELETIYRQAVADGE